MNDRLKMQTQNLADDNFAVLAKMFPGAVTETIDENGAVVRAIDKDVLAQEISAHVIEGREERYQFTWPDKRKAMLLANSSISKTLRPCREESVDFDNTENLYIEGDNLDVLKLLRETYLNRVKLIYADPPYNAGEDLLYKNKYEMSEEEFKKANFDTDEDGHITSLNRDTQGRYHTDWLNMMYARVKLAKNLLQEDGCMVLAIDHNELGNLIKLCNDVFSQQNCLGIITIIHKPEGRNQGKYFATSNEFALFYAKNITKFNLESILIDDSKKLEYEYSDEKGKYKLESLITKNRGRQGYDKNLKINNPKNHYPIYVSRDLKELSLDYVADYSEVLPNTKTQERTWRFIKETLQARIEQSEIVAIQDDDGIKIMEKQREERGQLIKTHWSDTRYNAAVHGTGILSDLMGSGVFDFPKSLYLMTDIVKLTTKKDSIILDLFGGSGTTAHAVMQVNSEDNGQRKVISVQLNLMLDEALDASAGESRNSIKITMEFLNRIGKPYVLSEIGKERIRRAGEKIRKKIESDNRQQKLDSEPKKVPDIGFRVLKLDSSNMKDVYYTPQDYKQFMLDGLVDNIKDDRTPEDLLFQVMLDLGIPLSKRIEEQAVGGGGTVFSVANGYLLACFEKIDEDVVMSIAKRKPYYAVFRDSSFDTDSTLVNFEQIFKTYSPETKRKVL